MVPVKKGGYAAFLITCAAVASSAIGQTAPDPLASLRQCRRIDDPVVRVSCYDVATDALTRAQQAREIAVVDRAQVRETRKRLFGLTLPALPVLGGVDGGAEIDRVESTVAGATMAAGGWAVTLADGSRWRQVDDVELGIRPRAGDKVVVRRAALGAFRMTIGRATGFKVRREG